MTGQLSLFTPQQATATLTKYPHQRQPNKKQRQIIIDVWGEEALPGITLFLNDIIDLYPFKSYVRNSQGQQFTCIGASCTKDHYFYCIDDNYCIYLEQQFSLFPDLTKH